MTSSDSSDRPPKWAEPALQAITFWIGWNHTRYRHWPLTEGALANELQRHIASGIDPNEVLCAEVDVKHLRDPTKSDDATIREGRVDLVLATKVKKRSPRNSEFCKSAKALIEIKRSKSGRKQIEDDILRLSQLSQHLNKGARCFLIVISEAGSLPPRFATEGTAVKGRQYLDNAKYPNVRYRVRRLCRAQAARNSSKSAHCACLVEVYGEQ